jgi:iron-sulfur cluster assembly protein
VKTYLEKDGGVGLRLGVKKTGCSGWAYTVDIAERLLEGDVVFEQDGIKVVVSSEAIGFLDGSELDFVSEGLNHEFRFRNPNVVEECGCGESFTINPV